MKIIVRIISLCTLLLWGFSGFCQDVVLSSQAEVDAFDPSISIVDGSLLIQGENIVSLSPLSNIVEINSNLVISNNSSLYSLEGLNNITTIVNDLIISNNHFLSNIDGLTSLATIGNNLEIFDDAIWTLPSLSNLTNIGNDLLINNVTFLENLDGLSGLNSVGNDVKLISNFYLDDIDGLVNLTFIGGDLDISLCDVLRDINGLNGLTSINGDLILVDNLTLTNVDGLSNLVSVGNDFTILNSWYLDNVSGLSKLSTVGRNFTISSIYGLNGFKLENLNGLENLTTVGNNLNITYNNELLNINGLNGLVSVGGGIDIINNPLLSGCCGIVPLLLNPSSVGGGINVNNNSLECNSSMEVLEGRCKPLIEGRVFYDSNQNKIQDNDEFAIRGIEIKREANSQKAISNEMGKFSLVGERGTNYNLSPELNNIWEITTENSNYQFTFDPENKPDITFGLFFPDPDPLPSCEINITSEPTRCNTKVIYYINIYNDGFKAHSGEVRIELDPKTSFDSASVDIEEIDGKLVHHFETLHPFESLTFTILVDMPSEQFTGEVINVSGEVFYDIENQLVSQDSTNYQSIVLCSYDPNDKQVSPVGTKNENYTLHDTELQYTVRFQNTGNAAAIDVTILDTLSENLDLETFNVVSSSFPVNTSLSDRAVEFYFQDIWLIDSLSNEPESHGYVSYTIKPKADLAEAIEIENTAHIIFDFNPAIITNTTKNTMVENLPSCPPTYVDDEEVLSFSISPNPFQDKFDVSIEHGRATSISVFDINGQLVTTREVSGSRCTLSLLGYPAGVYILKLRDDVSGHSFTQKVVKL